jgi:hypothetical protein
MKNAENSIIILVSLLGAKVMVFNATFNNISDISWWSVSLIIY